MEFRRRHTPIPFTPEAIKQIRNMLNLWGLPVECPGCKAEMKEGTRAAPGFSELFCPECHKNIVFDTPLDSLLN